MNPDDLDKPADANLLDAGDPEPKPAAPAAAEPEAEPAKPDAEQPEAAPELAKPAAEPQHAGSATVPHARFNEVNEQLKAERAARAELEAQLAAKAAGPATDIAALEKERNEAIYAGDVEKASELGAKIYKEIQRQATEEAFARSEYQAAVRENTREYQSAYQQCVKDYPFLGYVRDDSGSLVAVNEDAVNDTVALRDLNVAKGMSGPDALIAAAKVMSKVYSGGTEPLPANVEPITDKRKAAAIARNAKDSAAQPAALVAGVGARAVPATPMPKNQAEYEALPQAERDKLLA